MTDSCRICGIKEPILNCIVCQKCLEQGHEEWIIHYEKVTDPEDIGQSKKVDFEAIQTTITELVNNGFYIKYVMPCGM